MLETTTIIWHVLKKEVFPTVSEELWLKNAAEFLVMWDIPHCLGAVDGKQVHIRVSSLSFVKCIVESQFKIRCFIVLCATRERCACIFSNLSNITFFSFYLGFPTLWIKMVRVQEEALHDLHGCV